MMQDGYFSERWSRFRTLTPYLPATLRLVWGAAPRWMTLWACLLAAQGLLPVSIAYLTRAIVNRVVEIVKAPGNGLAPILPLVLLMGGAVLLGECITALLTWVKRAQSEFVWVHIAKIIHEKSAKVQMSFYDTPEFYDRIYRAQSDGPMRPLALIESIGTVAQEGITLAGIFVIMLPYGIWLPFLLLLTTVPALFLLGSHTIRQRDWRVRATPESRRLAYYDTVLTGRESAPEARVFGLAKWFQDRYVATCGFLRDGELSLAKRHAFEEAAAAATGVVATGAALLPMAYLAFQGRFSLGSLAFLYQIFQSGLRSVRSVSAQLVNVYSHTLFLDDLFRFLKLPEEPKPDTRIAVRPHERIRGSIVFRNVSFRYPGAKRMALSGFNLSIPAGGKVAILGANGSGKSTLIRLLCRFYDPIEGEIELDGAPLRSFSHEQLRRELAVLFQDSMRYSATAAENISLGDVESTDGESRLLAAACGSGADHFIRELPEAYETILGGRFSAGIEVSVGQWQQLALARAYFRNAPIVILDEPTSAMDPWAEGEWMDRFHDFAQGKTVILITHRLSTAFAADSIHLIKAGRVQESGTHEDLLALGGEYASAYLRQTTVRSGRCDGGLAGRPDVV
jgi:ATP-binding cassette, subfamily B, bacterial